MHTKPLKKPMNSTVNSKRHLTSHTSSSLATPSTTMMGDVIHQLSEVWLASQFTLPQCLPLRGR
jgi:hypothetical protein